MPVSQVFISYSHVNDTSADTLQADLEANGIRVWIDHESLIPGTPDFGQAIEDGIPQCQALIYVASAAAKKSPSVNHELVVADRFQIPVYPFWVEGADWLDAAPFGRGRTQYIDARSDYPRAFKKLLKSLQAQPTPVKPASSQGQTQPAPGVAVGSASSGSASKPHAPKKSHPVLRALATIAGVGAVVALIATLIVSGTPAALMSSLQARTATPTATAQRNAPTSTPTQLVSPTSTPLAPTSTPTKPTAHAAHWTQVISPNPNPNRDFISDIAAVAPNDIWMVGSTWDGGESPFHTLTEHWNGTSWTTISSPTPDTGGNLLNGVAALASNNVWAVGDVIEHWNGSSWTVTAKLNSGSSFKFLSGITALASDNIWAVGASSTISPETPDRTLIERWNGSTWQAVTSPNSGSNGNDLASIAAVSVDDIWAVGTIQKSADAGGPFGALVEHWNGSSWTLVSAPAPGAYSNGLASVTALASDNVWAVGYYQNNANDPDRALIEHWNGRVWSVVADASAGPGNNVLSGITALAPNDIWAVGTASQETLAEHWNGSSWAVIASPSPNPTYNSLNAIAAIASDNIWAAGANGNGTLTEHWGGSS